MTTSAGRERLAVFARTPDLGKVKTRLCPPLTPEQALELHRALVEDSLDRLQGLSRPGLEYWLYMSETMKRPGELSIPSTWKLNIQEGDNLGARLETAFRKAFDDGTERFIVLGSDSPTLPLHSIHEAFDELSSQDVVLGPARDGGYYLLGCSRFVPELFQNVSWGDRSVLRKTTEALKNAGRSFTLVVEWYDIDTESDLVRLREEIEYLSREEPDRVPRRVAAALPEEAGPDPLATPRSLL